LRAAYATSPRADDVIITPPAARVAARMRSDAVVDVFTIAVYAAIDAAAAARLFDAFIDSTFDISR